MKAGIAICLSDAVFPLKYSAGNAPSSFPVLSLGLNLCYKTVVISLQQQRGSVPLDPEGQGWGDHRALLEWGLFGGLELSLL